MKYLKIILVSVLVGGLSACIVAPPHAQYAAQANVSIAVPVSPYYYPDPYPVYVTPWINPYIGLNFWWGRHGHSGRR